MSEFIDSSKEIITNFLQTIVIVDDEAFLDEDCKMPTPEEQKALPSSIGRTGVDEAIGTSSSSVENSTEPHQLNAKQLSDKFASVGLMCTALRPENDEIDNYKKVLKKADIVILDWRLQEGDDGLTVKSLIKDIITDSSGNTQKSLRNIVIYSGENNLKEKLESVKDDLQSELGDPTFANDFTLEYNKLQIKIYAKEATQREPKDTNILKNEDNLVDAIIDDFVSQVAGLVPNMAIQSLSELRQNTHKILGVFSKELDEAYLSHRMMLPNSSDAESFMINILISELEAILLNSKEIAKSIDIENIMDWFDAKFGDDDYKRLLLNDFVMTKIPESKLEGVKEFFSYSEPIATLKQNNNLAELLNQKLSNDKEKVKELVKKLFTDNLETSTCKLIKQNDKKMKKLNEFSKCLYKDASNALAMENKFATLSILQTRYSSPKPYLTLGSIIKNTDGKYFLCIIPRCDAVRKEVTNPSYPSHTYPFLELKDAIDKFSLLINDSEYKKFTILDKPEELLTIAFKKTTGNANEPLYAVEEGEEKSFVTDGGEKFVWVTELKREKAQSILKSFADKFSRVGFNESEYIRRSGQ